MFVLGLALWFNVLLVVSSLSALLIFVLYIRAKKNILLIFCSGLLMVNHGCILIGQIIYGYGMSPQCLFCVPQAILLNYCYVGMHTLISCMMFDAWLHVKSWNQDKNFSISELMHKQRIIFYCAASFGFPLFPTLVILVLIGSDPIEPIIQPHAFFCYMTGDIYTKLITYAGWFALLSIPGLFFSSNLSIYI